MPRAQIMFFGQKIVVACDGRCDKAWGVNNRPSENYDPCDPDDCAWLTDDELGVAPDDPGTYEGGHAKPPNPRHFPNKWCVRECERCIHSGIGQAVELRDFSRRIFNQPWKHKPPA